MGHWKKTFMPEELVNAGDEISEFSILRITPGVEEEVTLEGVESFSQYDDEMGYNISRFVFDGTSLVGNSLPMEANPREPAQSTPVKKMKVTLEKAPDKFHLYNNGMTIFASRLAHIPGEGGNKGTVTLGFDKSDQGICNGGHTYFSCKRAIKEGLLSGEFRINAEVLILPEEYDEEGIKKATVEISRARNLNKQINEASIADQMGYFDKLRREFSPREGLIEWHENDSEADDNAIHATMLLRILECLNPVKYKHSQFKPNGKTHMGASMSAKSQVWKPWMADMEEGKKPRLEIMYPMAMEILELRDEIAKIIRDGSFSNFRRTNLWQRYMCNRVTNADGSTTHISKDRGALTDPETKVLKLEANVDVLILGLLRENIWIERDANGVVKLIGWYIEPKELIDKSLEDKLDILAAQFQECDSQPLTFCRQSGPYEAQLVSWGPFTLPPEEPHRLWEIGGERRSFKLTEAGATHRIERDSGSMTNESHPESKFSYIEVK